MIVGVSIGAAVAGLRPVPEIQFADFIFPAFNQILSEAARMRFRSNGAFACPMTLRAPYGGGVHGALYHSQSVEAFFAHIPGLKVVIPSTPYDARGMLRSAIRDDDPVLFFEHKKMYRSVRGEVPDDDYTVPLGSAKVTREGSDVTVIGYGLMAHYALEAADLLEGEGVSVEVVDLRTLRPLDGETVLACVRKTGKAVIVYEDNRFGGYGAEDRRDHRRGGVRVTSTARSFASPGPTCRACPTTTSSRTGSCPTQTASPTQCGDSPPTDVTGEIDEGGIVAKQLVLGIFATRRRPKPPSGASGRDRGLLRHRARPDRHPHRRRERSAQGAQDGQAQRRQGRDDRTRPGGGHPDRACLPVSSAAPRSATFARRDPPFPLRTVTG